ncbi:RING finger and transmembrane domain-containing protein 2 isoform X4 [Orcinus orca]|uniref:RING finger and transmembrane domain-containing protein 2 isoform X4 n=1 Tax=Orcinus orca TaxID=9733 RepID=UPI002112E266|nr:RING finger and transmembrane domain-containing protein 2 isoform X4 [Orcinus orca]
MPLERKKRERPAFSGIQWSHPHLNAHLRCRQHGVLKSLWFLTVNQVLRKMQRRHSSNTDNVPPERNRSQALSSEASVDEGGVFESLKAEAASPPALFSGLSGLPTGSLPATPFPSSLVLGAAAGGGDVFLQMPTSREEGGGRGEGGAYHHRQPHHHFHHGGHRGGSLLQHVGGDHRAHSDEAGDEQPGTPAPALSELKAVICWLQKGLPFILILLAKVCFQHKLGIAVCIGMASTFAYANSTLREQVSLKEKRSVLVILWILAFLAGNTLYVLYTFSSQQLYNSLIFLKPNLETLDFFDLLWIVGIADFVLKYITIALKCLVVALPKIILAVKSKIHVTAFGPQPDNPGYAPRAKSLNLIVSSNTLFPDEVTFTASRVWDLVSLGGHFFTYPVLWLKEG